MADTRLFLTLFPVEAFLGEAAEEAAEEAVEEVVEEAADLAAPLADVRVSVAVPGRSACRRLRRLASACRW